MAYPERKRYTTDEMLREELAHIRGDATRSADLNALCLSGGGIRSASFCLGVLQALAEAGLLKNFHYLSTVSGGGYIGGWLQQLIREHAKPLPELAPDTPENPAEARIYWAERELSKPAPPALRALRDHTNFLTPRTGIGSPDTSAGIALYSRNLMLNWMVLLPVFLLAALLPIMHRTLVWALGQDIVIGATLLGFASVALGCGVYWTCAGLPSHCLAPAPGAPVTDADRATHQARRRRIVIATLLWAAVLPIVLQCMLVRSEPWLFHDGFGAIGMWVLPLGYLAVMLMGYEIAARRAPRGDQNGGEEEQTSANAFALYRDNRRPWIIASAGTALLLLLLLRALWMARDWLVAYDGVADVLTLAAPILLIIVLLSQTTFYMGIRARSRHGDLDREWLARLSGIILGISVAWTLFAASCLIVPKLTLADTARSANPDAIFTLLSALGTLVSGFLASRAGKMASAKVESLVTTEGSGGWNTILLFKVLPVVFVVALFGLAGTTLQFSSGWIQSVVLEDWFSWLPPPAKTGLPAVTLWHILSAPSWCPKGFCGVTLPGFDAAKPLVVLIVLATLLVCLLSWYDRFINVNRFSLHALYRNRLTRAFLGTPRKHRHPEPFTGFDSDDDVYLKDFKTEGTHGQRLYPVVNITLNITAGGRDAWAERHGASFIATPLFCGAADLGAPARKSDIVPGAFVPTCYFAGMGTRHEKPNLGTRLGSMITVSGAAASPNMGYHSAPMIAFLMTLFNVRLGAWMPNPASVGKTIDDTSPIQLAKPHRSLQALLWELSGTTRADSQAIYLSDGGHFENLGVYEMIRRRCQNILVIDAGEDSKCGFFDLGMMIRKAEIDFPVKIEINTSQIVARAAMTQAKKDGRVITGIAHGRISYRDDDGMEMSTGRITYIKPTLLDEAPAAVHAYAADSPNFPHEGTEDQWFSESQFESYRSLGRYQADLLLGTQPQGEGWKAKAWAKLFPPTTPSAAE